MTGPEMINLIALDPGGTTGIAHYVCDVTYVHGDRESELGCRAFFTTAQATPNDALEYVSRMAHDAVSGPHLTVGFEHFVPRRRSFARTNQQAPHDVIGGLIEICRATGRPYVAQSPADAKHIGGTAALKRLGLWSPNADHANDAAAHALLMLVKLHPYEASRLYRHGRVIVDRT